MVNCIHTTPKHRIIYETRRFSQHQSRQSHSNPERLLALTPAPLPPDLNWTPTLITALSDAERELAKLTTLAGNFPFPRLLIQPFIRREAVLSSRIEGTHASLTDLYNFKSAQLSFLEPDDDVREVHNYVQAMDYGLERLDTLPVSLRLIRELHAKLMEGVRGGQLTGKIP